MRGFPLIASGLAGSPVRGPSMPRGGNFSCIGNHSSRLTAHGSLNAQICRIPHPGLLFPAFSRRSMTVIPKPIQRGFDTVLEPLVRGLIASYASARAEGLGLECKVGIAQRAERILVLGIPSVLFGAGPDGLLLLAIVLFLALTSVITVGQRIAHVYRITRALEAVPRRGAAPVMVDVPLKGSRGV